MRTKLKIDGVTSEVMELMYELERPTDNKGQVNARFQKGEITIKKESKYDKGSVWKWLSDLDEEKTGEIIMYSDDAMKKKLKTISFNRGKITKYKEEFIKDSNEAATETFTISSEQITVNDTALDFQWGDEE